MKFKNKIEPPKRESYPVVEEGDYHLFLADAEPKVNNGTGTAQVLCRFKGKGISIIQGFWYTHGNPKAQEIGRSMLGQIGGSTNVGAYDDTDEVSNRWFKAHVTVEKYNNRDQNRIHYFIDPDWTCVVPVVYDSNGKIKSFEDALAEAQSAPGPGSPDPEDDVPF